MKRGSESPKTDPCESRHSWQGRAGETGLVLTEWLSDSSVVCKAGNGWKGSRGMSVTVGGSAGSTSGGMSYDLWAMSALESGNICPTGSTSVSVLGTGFGSSRCAICCAHNMDNCLSLVSYIWLLLE